MVVHLKLIVDLRFVVLFGDLGFQVGVTVKFVQSLNGPGEYAPRTKGTPLASLSHQRE